MINSVTLVGHLGQAPQTKRTKAGEAYVILNLATSERWKDKASGERRERTDWHRIVVYSAPLVELAQKWLVKGSKIYVEGRLSSRKYVDEAIGRELYVTEVVLQGFNCRLIHFDQRKGGVPDPESADDYGQSRDHEREVA